MISQIVIFLLTSKMVESDIRNTPTPNPLDPTCVIPPQDETALVIKQGAVNLHDMTPVGINNFKELIDKSKAFIDNSIVIKELVVKSKQTLLLCPNKWGKSTMLTMLEMFLEIQVDEQGKRLEPREETPNWKFFCNGTLAHSTLEKPLLISTHTSVMESFMGKFPVIYINFENITGNSAAEIKHKISLVISRAFKKHEYIVKVLERKGEQSLRFFPNFTNYDLITFNEFLNNNATQNITQSLRFLTKVLNDHFRQTVFVLMDDYDTPIHNFLQTEKFKKNEVDEVLHFMESLATYTFKNNEYLHLTLITGTHSIGFPWNSFRIYYIPYEPSPLREYFAFTHEDVQAMVKKHDIPHKLSKHASNWYDGFESIFSKQHFYNPNSVLNFLHKKEITCYWQEKQCNKHFIRKVIRMKLASNIRREILLLISNQTILINDNLHLDMQTITQLMKLFSDEQKIYTPSSWFFSYLVGEGYLYKLPDSKPNQFRLVPAKLPNYEIAYLMAKWMISFYKEQFQIKENFLQQTAATLKNFLRSDGLNLTAQLQESLSELYKDGASLLDKITNYWDKKDTIVEDPAHAIFHCVALQMQCDTRFEINVYYSRSKIADVVIVDNDIGNGVIAHLIYKESSPHAAINFAENCSEIFVDLTEVQNMKFVGIHISPNATVQVLARAMKLDYGK